MVVMRFPLKLPGMINHVCPMTFFSDPKIEWKSSDFTIFVTSRNQRRRNQKQEENVRIVLRDDLISWVPTLGFLMKSGIMVFFFLKKGCISNESYKSGAIFHWTMMMGERVQVSTRKAGTHLKNISQNGNLPQIGMKIKIFETTT